MNKSFGCVRFVYNHFLNRRIESYQADKKSIHFFDMSKDLTLLKRLDHCKWLNEIVHQSLVQSIRSLDKAYTKFFREKNGFPKYKSKHNKQSFQFSEGVFINFEERKVRFPTFGWFKVAIDREFEGKIKTVTVSRNMVGRYFVSLLVDNGIELPVKHTIEEDSAIGIDVGIKHFAVLSTGEKIDNPKYYENAQKRLKCLQRRLSRKQKGSKRREQAKYAVAKCHYDIANKRKDFLHKLTTKIISENQTVIIEDLNVNGMLKNHCLAKSISSASWSEFFRQLEYKAEWNGKNVVKIGRFEPSSKMCSCGIINHELKLSDREWTCNSCNTTHDRDLLAAQNIKRFGLQRQNLIGNSLVGSEVGDVERSALVEAKKRQVKKNG